jgi:carboxylesterase type B
MSRRCSQSHPLVLFLLFFQWRSPLAADNATADNATAHTQFGPVDGAVVRARNGRRVRQWLSIPYAQPPLGALRFAPPAPFLGPFPSGRFRATHAGVYCVQTPYPGQQGPQPPGVEDCLVLSIWAPASPGAAAGVGAAPVLFWVHGGDFIQGNGDQYNGTELAAKHNVVVVAINYRLGDLGWLQPVAGLANFGLLDQRAALRWAHANIADFGGDPGRILLFGESAGAISVATHLLSPASDRLFATALMESGFPSAKDQPYALRIADAYSEAAGCSGEGRGGGSGSGSGINAKLRVACLRAAPLALLQAAAAAATALPPGAPPFGEVGWGPTVDGRAAGLPETPARMLASGRVNGGRAHVLAGTNQDEGTAFVFPQYPQGLNASAFHLLMRSMISGGAEALPVNQTLLARVMAEYPPNATRGADNRPLAARALADYSFNCGTRRLLARVAAQGVLAAAYKFDQKAAADPSPDDMGVQHGDEVPFVFDQGSWVGDAGFTPAEEALSTFMGGVWSNFSRTGTVPWPAFEGRPSSEEVEWLFRAIASKAQPYTDAAHCDFWDRNMPLTYL